jgi:nitroreductase
LQPWEFVVIRDKKKKEELWNAALKQNHVRDAPVVIVVGANLRKSSLRYRERGERLYCIQDTAAAIQNMLLAAHALGLGACWVGAFDEENVRLICGFPEHIRPVALLPIGYPRERPRMPRRIPFQNVSWIEEYRKNWTFEIKTLNRYVKELKEKIKESIKKT